MKIKYYLNKISNNEYNAPIIDGNKFIFSSLKKEVSLSKNQTKLLSCLLNDINQKKDIILFIWGKDNDKSNENNYNQLIHRTRALFISEGFADDFIMTIPRYGVCLNKNHLNLEIPKKYFSTNILNDHATCF
nr:hypothetical protein [uncultured Moellerella sp.]